MKLIHIIGRKNNGKTTLVVDLVKELCNRGLRIGTIKHSGHEHELDKPGKDSSLHREAGGNPSAIVTVNQMAVFMPRQPGSDPLEKIAPLFNNTDLIVIEGYIDGPGKKVEVWMKDTGAQPLLMERNDIEAVITNDSITTNLPVWPRNNISQVADHICKLAGIE